MGEGRQTGKPAPRVPLARVRHELRTPLNGILGYSEILLEDAEETGVYPVLDALDRIHRAGKELLGLVDERVQVVEPGTAATMWTDLRDLAQSPLETILEASSELFGKVQSRMPHLVSDVEKIARLGRDLEARIANLAELSPVPETEKPAEAPQTAGFARRPGESEPAKDVRGSVLVVDDQEANREVLARRLDKLGYDVAVASGGAEALEMLSHGGFDLVLLDVLMPDMDGEEVLARFRRNDAWRHVPVIMISALDEIDRVVRSIEAGAEDYLPKPFDPVLLRARVDSSIEKKKLRDKELVYLKDVARLTRAASGLELGRFDAEELAEVEERDDELGHLARVFRKMADEVRRREESLKRRVAELKIEIDQSKKEEQVSEITDSEYFRKLQRKARSLRRRIHDTLLP